MHHSDIKLPASLQLPGLVSVNNNTSIFWSFYLVVVSVVTYYKLKHFLDFLSWCKFRKCIIYN